AVAVFEDDPGDLRLAFGRGQGDEPVGHLVASGLFGLLRGRREAAARVEAAEGAPERTAGVGAGAGKDLSAVTPDAPRDTGPECGIAGRLDGPGKAESIRRKPGGTDVDTPCGDRAVVDDPHMRNVAVGKAQFNLA